MSAVPAVLTKDVQMLRNTLSILSRDSSLSHYEGNESSTGLLVPRVELAEASSSRDLDPPIAAGSYD